MVIMDGISCWSTYTGVALGDVGPRGREPSSDDL